jgi:hypothetical protein
MSSRSTQRIGRLFSVSWMQFLSSCEFLFPTDSNIGLLVGPTRMGVLEPSGNGLYLLPHQPELPSSPSAEKVRDPCSRVALVAHCDLVMWHRRFGHLNKQSLQAHHTHGVPTSPTLASSVKIVSYDSCLLRKATDAPRNTAACAKPSRPLLNMSSGLWGPVNVPSPHGLRYCLLVIDHHAHYMWVRFLKSMDGACSELETILLDIQHLHVRHHSHTCAFAPVTKCDSDSVFEAAVTCQCAPASASGYNSLPHMHITCSAKPNAHGALSGTVLLRCSTTWPSPIRCGHALSTLLCTSATARTTARSASLVAFLSLSLRRRCLTHPNSRLRVRRLRQSARQTTSETLRESVSWRHGWLSPRRTRVPRVQPRDSPHHHFRPCCLLGKHSGFRHTPLHQLGHHKPFG